MSACLSCWFTDSVMVNLSGSVSQSINYSIFIESVLIQPAGLCLRGLRGDTLRNCCKRQRPGCLIYTAPTECMPYWRVCWVYICMHRTGAVYMNAGRHCPHSLCIFVQFPLTQFLSPVPLVHNKQTLPCIDNIHHRLAYCDCNCLVSIK